MDNLFDLVGEFKEIYALLTDSEGEEQEVWEDTLDAKMGEIEVKGAGYVAILNRLDMEIDACRKQKDFWTHNLSVRENAVKRLKSKLAEAMIMLGKKEINAGDCKIKLQKNGGQLPIVYNGDVPAEYLKTKIIQEKDADKIRQALNDGKELDFATFGERGSHITIK